MSRSRVGVRGVAFGEARGCLCARRLYVQVGVPGQVRALGGGSGVMRGGSVRVRRPGLLTVGVCGEEASVGRRVAVRHFLIGREKGPTTVLLPQVTDNVGSSYPTPIHSNLK